MSASITFDPDPPEAGKPLTICYVDGVLPCTIDLVWDPAGEPPSVICNTDNGGCVTITVPANALALQASDGNGDAPFRDVPVVQPT